MRPKFLVTTSWDDGSVDDIKLSKLLLKYKIPATFYIPGNSKLRNSEINKLSKDFEIGGHTITHPKLTELSYMKAQNEMKSNKKSLEKIIGKSIYSFAYPFGRFNGNIKQLAGLCGFRYARTTGLFSKDIHDKMLVGTSVHAFSHMHLDWEFIAKRYFDFVIKTGGIFHLWGHSWELEQTDSWNKLERVLEYVSSKSKPEQRTTNFGSLQFYDQKKYDYYSNLVDEQRSPDKIVLKYLDQFDKKGNVILDLGCGTGFISEYIESAKYIGVDYRMPGKSSKNRKFIKSDLSGKLNFKADLILILGLFEDETDPVTRTEKLRYKKLLYTLHNSENFRFKLSRFVKSKILSSDFPYACFSESFLRKMKLGKIRAHKEVIYVEN